MAIRSLLTLTAAVLISIAGLPSGHGQTDHRRPPLPSAEAIALLPPDGGPGFNRLVFEKSPYLLQHAANPVDWYPWGEEAFEKALAEDKPIWLSIGYSTCHWCHVMEFESFVNDEVAELMNRNFVAIKVDREERPDIDELYMSISIKTRGSGGWPLNVAMTPRKKPFFMGTYFPLRRNATKPGMLELLPALAEAWKSDRENILSTADQLTQSLEKRTPSGGPDSLGEETLKRAFGQIASRYDPIHGGVGEGQKFPFPTYYPFLLRYWKRTGEVHALDMVETTLQAMRRGGLFDHVGFGFHRYTIDTDWRTPHFEKMLYTQALLAIAYLETFQATGREFYARTAREIFTYVLRDMTSPRGAFYSAEDADSDGEEGRFYTWTIDEVRRLLEPSEAQLVIERFGFTPEGNYRDQATGEPTGRNVLFIEDSPERSAETLGISIETRDQRLGAAREKLFSARSRRVRPFKDDKILTDWNGLMIAALARGAAVLDEPRYARAAKRSAQFIWESLRREDGRLLKRHRDGESGLPALLDDYAFTIWGMLELYEATFEVIHLKRAIELSRILVRDFWDPEASGFFMAAHGESSAPARSKPLRDGSMPSGNAVAALNLLRLSRMTADPELEAKARAIFTTFAAEIHPGAAGHTQMLSALDFALGPSYEVVIAGEPNRDDTARMLRALRSSFAPNKVVLFRPAGVQSPPVAELAEFTLYQRARGGSATAYVCLNYACKEPTTDPCAMLMFLGATDTRPNL